MITLKTLPQATAQEVFEQGARHMLMQGEPCINDEGHCVYRSGELKCVGGCFISDGEYKTSMESKVWEVLMEERLVPCDHHELIGEMQSIHDEFKDFPDLWQRELFSLGSRFNLNTDFIKEIQ